MKRLCEVRNSKSETRRRPEGLSPKFGFRTFFRTSDFGFRISFGLWVLVFGVSCHADCTLTNLGIQALPDLGWSVYKSNVIGGLYPNGSNTRPPAHQAAGVRIAEEEVLPLDENGIVNTNRGKIILMSLGMSNTAQEWADKGTNSFARLANADPAKNPWLFIVNGAVNGNDAPKWTNYDASVWTLSQGRLISVNGTTNQVQVLWIKQAVAGPGYRGEFPVHAWR